MRAGLVLACGNSGDLNVFFGGWRDNLALVSRLAHWGRVVTDKRQLFRTISSRAWRRPMGLRRCHVLWRAAAPGEGVLERCFAASCTDKMRCAAGLPCDRRSRAAGAGALAIGELAPLGSCGSTRRRSLKALLKRVSLMKKMSAPPVSLMTGGAGRGVRARAFGP